MARGLLENRLLMCQGQLALFDKNLSEALTIVQECDKKEFKPADQEQELQLAYDLYVTETEELPF